MHHKSGECPKLPSSRLFSIWKAHPQSQSANDLEELGQFRRGEGRGAEDGCMT